MEKQKKVTVKDVAREAGVSVATVSYIMNNRTDMKISESTKKKVLQIANLMNYKPNSAAKALVTGHNSCIGIAYRLYEASPGRNLEISEFSNMLIERLNRQKYDVLILPIPEDEAEAHYNRNVDAIIAIDLTEDQFKRLSDNYYVPIINIDMFVHDNLFYQIYTDYPAMIDASKVVLGKDFFLLIDRWANDAYQEYIVSGFPSDRIILFSQCNVSTLSKLANEKVLVIGSYLGYVVSPYVKPDNMVIISSKDDNPIVSEKVHILHNDISKKANVTINMVMNALDKKFDFEHDIKV